MSRALSNPDLLTETTRQAVFDAIKATGYRANRAARNLRTQRSGAVLVLVPNLGNPFFSRILSGLSEAFAEREYSVLILDTLHTGHNSSTLVDYFQDGRVDGMVCLDGSLTPETVSMLSMRGAEGRIVCACEWIAAAELPSVRSDNRAGAVLAIQHLAELGHRHIAHVTGPADNVLTHERREGMLAERARLGLQARPEWIIRGDFSLGSGRDAANQIAAMTNRPTAVFCASDEVALGLIAGLNEHGLRVPEDISLIGFDDIDQAEFTLPGLTTVRQDRHRLGRRAAERLLEGLSPRGATTGPLVETIDVSLVVRASTAPPRSV